MPADIRIIHAHEFIEATPEGRLDLEKSEELLLEIVSATGPLGDYDIILDTREAKSELSPNDLRHLAFEVTKFRKAFSRKTAIVVPRERFDYAAFLALCAEERGFQVRPFTSLGDAMEWLIEPESTTFRKRHPPRDSF